MSNAETFAGKINAWAAETQERMDAVFRDAVQEVVAAMTKPITKGGNLPIRDGFLRSSVQVGLGDVLPLKTKRAPGAAGPVPFDEGESTLVIANATHKDKITVAFTAAYARRLEYGFVGADSLGRIYNQSGFHFVALAAQRWPQIVSRSAEKARNAVANSSARPGMAHLAAVERAL